MTCLKKVLNTHFIKVYYIEFPIRIRCFPTEICGFLCLSNCIDVGPELQECRNYPCHLSAASRCSMEQWSAPLAIDGGWDGRRRLDIDWHLILNHKFAHQVAMAFDSCIVQDAESTPIQLIN